VRYKITITNNVAIDLQDYAILLSFDYTSTIWNYIDSEGLELYFVDENGNPLYYWKEVFDYANKILKVWVKIPFIPANGTVTIYMVVGEGNPYASYEDPFNVFIFFDDFRDGQLHGWDTAPTVVQEDSNYVVELNADGVNELSKTFSTVIDASQVGLELRLKYKHVQQGQYGPRLVILLGNSETGEDYRVVNEIGSTTSDYYWLGHRNPDGTKTKLVTNGNTITFGVWYDENYLRIFGDKVVGKLGESSVMEATHTALRQFDKITISTWDSGNIARIDNVILRYYVDPEPSYNVEELYSATVDIVVKTYDVVDIAVKTYDVLDITVTTFKPTKKTVFPWWILLLLAFGLAYARERMKEQERY